jgi:hypothetical protein
MSIMEGLQIALHQATGRLGYLAFAAVLVRMHGRHGLHCLLMPAAQRNLAT